MFDTILLFPLRADLEVMEGPNDQGMPTYTLFDPIKNAFYTLSWREKLLIQYWRTGMEAGAFAEHIKRVTTVDVGELEVIAFMNDLKAKNLLVQGKTADELYSDYEKESKFSFGKSLMKYCFYRLPLWNPDHFLEATLPLVRLFFSPLLRMVYGLLIVLGLILLATRFDAFLHTFLYFFSPQGLLAYGCVIVGVKCLHELAHAYTAKHYGLHVPRIGVIFMFLMPLLYTDVTDGWRLKSRKARLAISSAGVGIEILVAALSTFGWVLAPPGIWQSVFFLLASTTWISTLLVNMNPGIRLDGYYILSDLWKIDNLQSRSTAVARWALHKVFLGIDTPPPEEGLRRRRIWGLTLYAIYVWVYRVFLYLSIGILIYTRFTKALGVLLLGVQFMRMWLYPLISEVRSIIKVKEEMTMNVRLILTLIVLGAAGTWFFVPVPHRTYFPAITVAEEKQTLYLVNSGLVEEVFVERGAYVTPGTPLLSIHSPSLEYALATTTVEEKLLLEELKVLQGAEYQELLPEKEAELAALQEHKRVLEEKEKQNTLYAMEEGEVLYWDDYLIEGLAIQEGTAVGAVAAPGRYTIRAFIPEEQKEQVKVGDRVLFRPTGSDDTVEGSIQFIQPVRASSLSYPQLASTYGGPLAVSEDMELLDVFYLVEVECADEASLPFGRTGEIEGAPVTFSMGEKVWRRLQTVMWQESAL